MSLKLIQISDLHLFADPAAELKGIRTESGVNAILEHIRIHHPDFDHLVISGDHTHDELQDTYERIRKKLEPWLPRTHIIPGNHDDRAVIRQVFPELVPLTGERLTFQFQSDKWNIIGIDSHVPGELWGEVGPDQWNWLQQAILRFPDRTAVLFLHHPPLPIDSPWMDENLLRDPAGLREVIHSAPQLRLICHGHIHQEFEGAFEGVPVRSVPSAAIQFSPRTTVLEIDPIPPGYREIQLSEAGEFHTKIIRVPVPL